MKYAVGLSLVAGLALGAAATHGLHAQASLAAFSVSEIDITDQAGYAPISAMLVAENQKAGAKTLVRAGRIEAVEGTAPKRVVINQWKSMDDAKKHYAQPIIKKGFEDRKKFTSGSRIFIVEALPN
jgi:uncharacterized protein (DUF1330 family)